MNAPDSHPAFAITQTNAPEPGRAPRPGDAAVLDAIVGRRSVRAFSDRPVARETLRAILDAARWSPSGANMQPWDVHVVTGAGKEAVTRAILEARGAGVRIKPDYDYYPARWFEPYGRRRATLGMAMYRAIGARRSKEGREESWNRNYAFFGAPAAMLFFIHRDLAQGSWIDYGMFLQTVMLASRAHGLETCPQAALTGYSDAVRAVLGLGPERLMVASLCIGHPDRDQPVNRFERTRAGVDEFATFHD